MNVKNSSISNNLLYSIIHVQIYAEHNQPKWRTSMNERIHFFMKYISHTLSLKGWCFLRVRGEWRQGRTAILTQVLLTIAALLPHVGLGCSTVGHWEPKALCPATGSHFGILSPTDSNRPGHLVISLSHVHLLPLFFRLFTQVHLLIDDSVEGQY